MGVGPERPPSSHRPHRAAPRGRLAKPSSGLSRNGQLLRLGEGRFRVGGPHGKLAGRLELAGFGRICQDLSGFGAVLGLILKILYILQSWVTSHGYRCGSVTWVEIVVLHLLCLLGDDRP